MVSLGYLSGFVSRISFTLVDFRPVISRNKTSMVSFNIAITTEPTAREAYCQLRESHASNQRQQIRGIIVITAREKFSYALSTACGHKMAHRKWKETKQQPRMLSGPAVPGCCLVSLHIPRDILSTSTVLPASKEGSPRMRGA